MADVLSQSQIDALLKSMASGGAPEPEASVPEEVEAKVDKKAEKAEEIKETALQIYRLLRCSGFARVDMFLTPEGEIYFNEVNTIPGFTSHSRYPNMLKEAGLSFAEVIERLLGQGV